MIRFLLRLLCAIGWHDWPRWTLSKGGKMMPSGEPIVGIPCYVRICRRCRKRAFRI